jgi:hypothetical protein
VFNVDLFIELSIFQPSQKILLCNALIFFYPIL